MYLKSVVVVLTLCAVSIAAEPNSKPDAQSQLDNQVNKTDGKSAELKFDAIEVENTSTLSGFSEEQRSIFAYYRMGTVARHKGNAQEATKAYESIIKISVGEQEEVFHKIVSNMYLAEIASDIYKDNQLAIKRLQEAVAAANSIDTTKMEHDHAGVCTVLKEWPSYQLAKLEGHKSSAAKTSCDKSEAEGIFLLVMRINQIALDGTGFTLEQLVQDGKSQIDTDIAQLSLVYNCMNNSTDIPKAEKYFSSLAQGDSYFASYAVYMLKIVQEESQKNFQKPATQQEIKQPKETIPEISHDQIFRLIKEIKSEDGKVRDAAIRELTVKTGPEGIKALEQAQKSSDKYTSYWAAIALSQAKQTSIKPDIHLLIEAMGDSNKSLWWEAACALNGTNPPTLEQEEIGTLIAMAKCPKERTADRSGDMAEILGNCLSSKAEMAVPEIVKLLHDDNEYTKMHACIILRKMGPSASAAFPELVKYLNSSNNAVRKFAIEAMKSISPKETETLVKKQEHEKSLSSIKKTTELLPRIPEALEKLGNPDIAIRREGIKIFALLQKEPEWKIDTTTETGKQVIHALVKAASDSDFSVRMGAQEALCKLHVVEAIPVYIDILNEKNNISSFKEETAKALEAIGPAAKDAVPALNNIASTNKGGVSNAARAALISICGDAIYVPQLMEDIKSSQKETRRGAILALGRSRSDEAKAAIPALIEILSNESEDENCRIAAAEALGWMKAAVAVPVLVKFSEENNIRKIRLRSACIGALGLMGDAAKPAIPVLIGILKNKRESVIARGHAARSLGNLKAEEAIPLLMTILKQKGELADMAEDSHIRSNAATALGLMGAKAKDAVQMLTECSADDNTEVADAASKAIKKIKG